MKLNLVDKITLFIALILAFGLLGGIWAGKCDPRHFCLISFLGLAFPFFLLFNVMMALYAIIRAKYIVLIIPLLVMLYGFSNIKSTFNLFGNEGNIIKQEHHIRMMTYNVRNFNAYEKDDKEGARTKMLSLIKKQNPDIICFQEYLTRFKGVYNVTDSLIKRLKMPYFYFEPSRKNDYEAIGLAIFSKYPIKHQDKINFQLENLGNRSIFADIEINKKIIRIYNIHLQSISFEHQDYQYIDEVTKEMLPNKKSSRRIFKMLDSAFKKRAEQVEIMKKELEKCTTDYILAGDFNDTPTSFAVTQLTEKLNNSFIKQGSGFGRTYNGKFPNFQIDYIASTKNIKIENYCIIKAKLSDHFPVRSDISLSNTKF